MCPQTKYLQSLSACITMMVLWGIVWQGNKQLLSQLLSSIRFSRPNQNPLAHVHYYAYIGESLFDLGSSVSAVKGWHGCTDYRSTLRWALRRLEVSHSKAMPRLLEEAWHPSFRNLNHMRRSQLRQNKVATQLLTGAWHKYIIGIFNLT
jgi:hypothetical protein